MSIVSINIDIVGSIYRDNIYGSTNNILTDAYC